MRRIAIVICLLVSLVGCGSDFSPASPSIEFTESTPIQTMEDMFDTALTGYCTGTPIPFDLSDAIQSRSFNADYCGHIRAINLLADRAPIGSIVIQWDASIWHSWPDSEICFTRQPWYDDTLAFISTFGCTN